MKRTIGVQWQPIPVSLCAELCKLRHTPASPAPRAVVYAWCWHMLHQNADISIREVANYAGWSRWKAEQIRRLVVADIQAWKVKPDDSSHHARQNQTRSSHQNESKPDSYESKPDTKPDDSRQAPDDHARVNKELQLKNSTSTKKEKDSSWKLVWEQVKVIYGENVPGAKPEQLVLGKARKKALCSRISEYGAEQVVAVARWIYTSRHERATFVREHGTLDTVFRASKFPQYFEFMVQESSKPQQLPEQTFAKPAPKPKPSIGWNAEQRNALIARARSELQEIKDIFTEDQFEKAVLVEAKRLFSKERARSIL